MSQSQPSRLCNSTHLWLLKTSSASEPRGSGLRFLGLALTDSGLGFRVVQGIYDEGFSVHLRLMYSLGSEEVP